MIRLAAGSTIVVIAAIACGYAPSAQAMTMKECSAKYQAAQQAGALNGASWAAFRQAECASTSSQTASASASAATTRPSTSVASNKTPAPAGNAVFPAAVSPKYSSETAGKARMHTCLDQYHINKTDNGNGGLRWIQKGGGYYSECTKRLKS